MISQEGIRAEALGILSKAQAGGVSLRLLGGLAVKLSCPSADSGPLARSCGDMDFASLDSGPKVEAFFLEAGWAPMVEFNLYNGAERLIFGSPGGCKADIFLGRFSMCHPIVFRGRLPVDEIRLPLAELLLTKLQVVEANAKDLSDAAAILLDHGLGEGDGDCINRGILSQVLGEDWGFWRTARGSLEKIAAWLPGSGLGPGDRAILEERLTEARGLLDTCPKGPRWRIRSLVGEKLRWYETPEEAEA